MIDLSRTREELLAEIGAPDVERESLSDITDPRVPTSDVHVRLCGRGRDDLFPLLKLALSERFRAVPRLNLTVDLLMPLKNALGNAYKHGNLADPAKAVSVEIVLTHKGAFIAITDQGLGFDVALTFQRFQEQQDYFEHFGIGFRNFHRSMSTVSYENAGRTVLLCYRPIEGPDHATSSCLASTCDSATAGRGHALPNVFNTRWIEACLPAELPELDNGQAQLESCRLYAAGDDPACGWGPRYVLRTANRKGAPAETRILTGRLHASEATARADFEAAARMREAMISKSVRIPRPVARLAGEPRLVLYDFDPWLELGEYLAYRAKLKSVRHCIGRFGRALARLHRSRVVFPDTSPDPASAALQAKVARAEAILQSLPSGSAAVNRFRAWLERDQERAAVRQQTAVPIHGGLGWDCILFGVDGEFYLYRFESCRHSDARFDLAGFAADLLCFTLDAYDGAAYRLCNNAFLSHYNEKAEYPVREADLQPYIVLALCERLQRTGARKKGRAAQLLAALDTMLCEKGAAAASEVSS